MKILFRKVEPSDMQMLYEWANDMLTRTNSFNTTSISFDEHKKWFEKQLCSTNVLFLIALHETDCIGQVRFVINDNKAEINYSINPLFRGHGYGYSMLLLSEKELKKWYPGVSLLYGEVKSDNIPSLTIFRRIGFSEVRLSRFAKNIDSKA
jgi:RimJ/RimL family protein N-acetyltransferase